MNVGKKSLSSRQKFVKENPNPLQNSSKKGNIYIFVLYIKLILFGG